MTRNAHPADDLLRTVRKQYESAYNAAKSSVFRLLSRYFSAQVKQDASQTDAYLALSSPSWRKAEHEAAGILHRANDAALKKVNAALAGVWADGANRALYRLHPEDGELLPYTTEIVRELARSGDVRLATRAFKADKDVKWQEKRLQTIARTAVSQTEPWKYADYIASSAVLSAKNGMDATAQAMVFGAFDSGVYQAGLDAVEAGMDVSKTWLGILDSHIRDSHRHLHGTTVPLDGVFHGLNGDLRYPHDPDAPAAETMRCRCRMAVHASDAPVKVRYADVLPTQTTEYRRWRDSAIRKAGKTLMAQHRR